MSSRSYKRRQRRKALKKWRKVNGPKTHLATNNPERKKKNHNY